MMRTQTGTFRTMACLMFALIVSTVLAACGGGGGTSSTSLGSSGPAMLSVSVASAPSYPAGTTFAPSTLSASTAAQPNSPTFDNVFVWVNKLALIPSTGPEFPDQNGELETDKNDVMPGFVTITLPNPVRIDLLNPPTGQQVAKLLNKFSEAPVPAGAYSKIRVYYDNVVGHTAGVPDTVFHPTAHYHFDVHFVGGNLVIPVAAPQDGIRFFSIVIKVVGLKYHQAGNSGNVLLRPQVFAEFVPPILYSVEGTVANVEKTILSNSVSGSFDVLFGTAPPVPVTFDNNTVWSYSDNVLARSIWKILDVPNQKAADAFKDRAEVIVIGSFDDGTFRGTDIMFTFPDVREGKADNVWILDNTAFIVRSLTDNVTVFPKPSRSTAFYDNLATPSTWNAADQVFFFTGLDNNFQARARGYFEGQDLWSYWISYRAPVIGP